MLQLQGHLDRVQPPLLVVSTPQNGPNVPLDPSFGPQLHLWPWFGLSWAWVPGGHEQVIKHRPLHISLHFQRGQSYWKRSLVNFRYGTPCRRAFQGKILMCIQAKVSHNGGKLHFDSPRRIFSQTIQERKLEVWLLQTQWTARKVSGTDWVRGFLVLVLKSGPFPQPQNTFGGHWGQIP